MRQQQPFSQLTSICVLLDQSAGAIQLFLHFWIGECKWICDEVHYCNWWNRHNEQRMVLDLTPCPSRRRTFLCSTQITWTTGSTILLCRIAQSDWFLEFGLAVDVVNLVESFNHKLDIVAPTMVISAKLGETTTNWSTLRLKAGLVFLLRSCIYTVVPLHSNTGSPYMRTSFIGSTRIRI